MVMTAEGKVTEEDLLVNGNLLVFFDNSPLHPSIMLNNVL